jgi:transcriptional regulator with XRE-family HTH domain
MPFPETLRRQRLGQFLSQAELARRSDLHTLTISRLETGRAKPSTRTVRALADALGITPGELATPEEVAEADKGALPSQRPTRDGAIS